jgi:transposase
MEKMQIATLIDKHFPTHGNWQGLSLGKIVTVWLAYILSEGDHRLSAVQKWVAGLLISLTMCLQLIAIRELDFTDHRLCTVLDHLGKNDDSWENYERDQNATLLRVYDLKPRQIRIDSTTANSYVTVTDDGFEWQEQRLVVQSLKHKDAQQKALDTRLKKAVQEIEVLNKVGRGRKRLNEVETRAAVDAILERHKVTNLLTIEYKVETETKHKRSYLGRPARHETTTTVTVKVVHDAAAYENAVRNLGWRVFVSNNLALSLTEAVLAYREQYIVERGFNRYRGKILGLTPLFLSSSTRIKGLIRLLCIGLRVLCVFEFTVRENLREKGEKLSGIYNGNPKRATAKPTTELMLKAFEGISLTVVSLGEKIWYSVTALSAVQLRILDLLGFPTSIYQGKA